MECQDEFAQLLLAGDDLSLALISHLLMIYYILNNFIQRLLGLLYIHYLLQLALRLLLQFFGLLSQELFVPLEVVRNYKLLELHFLRWEIS